MALTKKKKNTSKKTTKKTAIKKSKKAKTSSLPDNSAVNPLTRQWHEKQAPSNSGFLPREDQEQRIKGKNPPIPKYLPSTQKR